MKQYHLFIIGDVIGVGYRSWMKREASKLGIVGWVKNRDDQAVEAVVQGEDKNVQDIIALCKKGPTVAWVEKVEVREEPVDLHLIEFEVIY